MQLIREVLTAKSHQSLEVRIWTLNKENRVGVCSTTAQPGDIVVGSWLDGIRKRAHGEVDLGRGQSRRASQKEC